MAANWSQRETCRLCDSRNLRPFLSLGELPPAGAFLRPSQVADEKRYPLTVCFCETCTEVQLLESVNPEILFRDYRYLASSTVTLSKHFENYAVEISKRFLLPGDLVVEIGSNDGVLLKPFQSCGVRAVGVEPAGNIAAVAIARNCTVYNAFFDSATAKLILKEQGPAAVVCANNVFAHVDNLAGILQGIDILLSKDGIFVFEVQSLLDLLAGSQYDMIYHEHLMYHSLGALMKFFSRFEMQVFDLQRIPTHCGSIRVMVQRNASPNPEPISPRVGEFLALEFAEELNLPGTFDRFAGEVRRKSRELSDLVETIQAAGGRIAGYGASGRASVHVNLSHLSVEKIPYIVDGSSERIGRFMPGTHNPIVDAETFRADDADYALVFAYNYLAEIRKKETAFEARGGKWIVPLPEPTILP